MFETFPAITEKDPFVNALFHVHWQFGWVSPSFVILHDNYVQLRMPFPSSWLHIVYDGGPPHLWNAYGGLLNPFFVPVPYP